MSEKPLASAVMPECTCPACGYVIDRAADPTQQGRVPERGDFSVCFDCACILVFETCDSCGDLFLRLPEPDEAFELEDNHPEVCIQLSQTQMAVAQRKHAEDPMWQPPWMHQNFEPRDVRHGHGVEPVPRASRPPGAPTMKLIATQSANVSVKFRNANGFPVQVDDGMVTWASDTTSIATVSVDPENPYKATITAQGSPGVANVTATADADLGDGVTEVTATIEVEVIARGQAVGGEIDVDTPDQGLPPIPDNSVPGGGNPSPTPAE